MKSKLKHWILWGILGGILLIVGLGAMGYFVLSSTPNFSELLTSTTIEVRRHDGKMTQRQIGPRAPGWVPLSGISKYFLAAVISSEDTTFLSHEGVDLHELKEAVKKDIKEKRFARGASTITQQVVKNVFLHNEKTLWRKFREVLWAWEMEKALTKEQILQFYANMVELGPGVYGVNQASSYYFDCPPNDLTPREAAFLAMLLPSPRKYHNANFPKRTLTDWASKRVDRILELMHRFDYIGDVELRQGREQVLWQNEATPSDEIMPYESRELEEALSPDSKKNEVETQTTESMEINVPEPNVVAPDEESRVEDHSKTAPRPALPE